MTIKKLLLITFIAVASLFALDLARHEVYAREGKLQQAASTAIAHAQPQPTPTPLRRGRLPFPVSTPASRVKGQEQWGDAVARFEWSMAPRVNQSRRGRAYNAETRTYGADYVYPAGWRVNFDACASSGGDSHILTYIWEIKGGAGEAFHHVITTPSCQFNHAPPPKPTLPRHCWEDPDPDRCPDLEEYLEERAEASTPRPPLFPAEGSYQVTLTVKTGLGAVDTVTQTVVVQDWLLVSIGDSNASGEGNPDLPADWALDRLDISAPIWEDPRCNRSWTSGPVLAAQQIEGQDPHSAVTFLSFACSGADLADIAAQVEQARKLLCGAANPCREDVRRIDALLISGGVNDLGFSSVIKACANFATEDIDSIVLGHLLPYDTRGTLCHHHLAGFINRGIYSLYGKYRSLAAQIATALNPVEVYITEYPTRVFFDEERAAGGCGLFDEISADEAVWITETAQRLNAEIQKSALARDWTYVDGIAERFRGHGYCADDYWFVELSASLLDQLGIKGAVHPNHQGHTATAARIVASFLSPKPNRTPVKRVTVTFEQVKVLDEVERPSGIEPTITVRFITNNTKDPRNVKSGELSLTPGAWVNLPQDEYHYTWEIATGDDIKVHAQTTLPRVQKLHPRTFEPIEVVPARRLVINQRYGANDNYGGGVHTATSNYADGSLTVRYRIAVQMIPPTIPDLPTFPEEAKPIQRSP